MLKNGLFKLNLNENAIDYIDKIMYNTNIVK